LIIFTMGGLTGVMVGLAPFDWQAHDTYFVVAHLHYVLIGGMLFPFIAALYYWAPLTSRRPLSERLGKWVFWLMFIGTHVTFLPMHLTGFMGMPRRVYTYLEGHGWNWLNLVSSVGSFIIAAGVVLFIIDLFRNFRFSVEQNKGNVFGAGTLEWLPNGLYSSRSIPVVRGRYPLWDNPDLAKEVEEGRHLLPYSATGRRESLVTSPMRAEPQYLQIVPGPSAWHFWAAVMTAAAFLLVTVQAYWAGLFCGVLAIAAVFRWAWEPDHRIEVDEVDVGEGIMLPTYVSGVWSHGWWAMCALLVVVGMIFLMGLFSYVFLWSRNIDSWAAPPDQLWLGVILAAAAFAAASAWLAPRALRRWKRTGPAIATGLVLCSVAALTAAFLTDMASWWEAGLRPDMSSQGAIVFGLSVLLGTLVATAIIMGVFVLARSIAGLVSARLPASLEVICLFLIYTAIQTAVGAAVVRLFPGA
jgi:cytochrome c oxidase subunit I+III